MNLSMQLVIDGVAIGIIYGLVALSLLLIYRSTGVLNFAQAEMATFSAHVGWTLLVTIGMGFWTGFTLAVVFAFLLGVLVERVFVRPASKHSPLTVMIVTIGLFLMFNSFQRDWWASGAKAFPTPFPAGTIEFGGARISWVTIGILVVSATVMAALSALFRLTTVGLAMRAVVANPTASSLMGIKNERIIALGWGLASAVGAIAAMLAANLLLLDPGTAYALLLYSFAALVLAGMTSPVGAVVCGVLLGVLNAVAGSISFIGNDLSTVATFAVLIAVLALKPGGLFGKAPVVKV